MQRALCPHSNRASAQHLTILPISAHIALVTNLRVACVHHLARLPIQFGVTRIWVFTQCGVVDSAGELIGAFDTVPGIGPVTTFPRLY
jgi:hypothetical protein